MSEENGAVNLKHLAAIVRKIEAPKAKNDDARADLGNIYQDAEERGFNRRALKEAVRLKNMEEDKRSDYLTSLAQYCEELGVWAQGDLFGHAPRTPADGALRRARRHLGGGENGEPLH